MRRGRITVPGRGYLFSVIPIGATLAAARKARGLGLREAEALTCMRARYLIALETEHFDDLPGHTYARAFLRTYSSALELDADRIVAEFDDQVPEPVEPAELSPAPRRRPALVSARAAPLAGFVAVFAVLAWAAWTNHGSSRALAPPPVSHAVHLSVLPVPQVHVAVPPTRTPAARRTSPVLVLRVTGGPCWVEARRTGPSGALLVERTLQAGESLRLGATHVWLRLGAPWNVDVRRGGHVLQLDGTTQPVNVVA